MDIILLAFIMSFVAGMSTLIGSASVLFVKKFNKNLLSWALGFSAGVMIYVSFVELFKESQTYLINTFGNMTGMKIFLISFFSGMFVIALIDRLLPEITIPYDLEKIKKTDLQKLHKTSILTTIIVILHNIPEGIITFTSFLVDPVFGFAVTIAIALHNIPEGIAVSLPVYFSTKNKKKALFFGLLASIAEPFGAFIAYFFLNNFMNPKIMGIILAVVSGMMIFLSLDELLPSAREHCESNFSEFGLVTGMMVMAISLLFL